MRVYGLKLPMKSQGWLLAVICFGLAVLHPPFSGLSASGNLPFDSAAFGWRFNFSSLLATGGIAWHVISYLHWRSMFYPSSDRMLVTLFAPYCFVPVVLALCVAILWRRLVDYAQSPTILRGVLSVLFALISSLVLIFVLDQIGGRMFIYTTHISFTGNLEVRALMTNVWITAVVQSALLALPCLIIGGLLAWRQRRLESHMGFARRASG